MVRDCIAADVPADGWKFLTEQGINVRPIREGASYEGFRAVFAGCLGRSRIRMQLDVGIGDEVVPAPGRILMPTLLAQPAPDLLCYSPYTSVAEKLDAIVLLGLANSRMKDYFDIAFLSKHMDFTGGRLRDAIRACCRGRRTGLSGGLPDGLGEGFEFDEVAGERWLGFMQKASLHAHATTWRGTVRECRRFLAGPLAAASENSPFDMHWPAGGPWRSS